jgi:hypothetical protein
MEEGKTHKTPTGGDLEVFFQHQMGYLFRDRPHPLSVRLHDYWMTWLPVVKADVMRVYPGGGRSDWLNEDRRYPTVLRDIEDYYASRNEPGLVEFVDYVRTAEIGSGVGHATTRQEREAEWDRLWAAERAALAIVGEGLSDEPAIRWKGRLRFGLSRDITCGCQLDALIEKVSCLFPGASS